MYENVYSTAVPGTWLVSIIILCGPIIPQDDGQKNTNQSGVDKTVDQSNNFDGKTNQAKSSPYTTNDHVKK